MKKLPQKPASSPSAISAQKIADHRFKPGQSGNPSGRPKTAHISQALRDELEALAPDGTRTNAQAIARRAITAARDSKRDSQAIQAAEFIADRVEGKPLQAVAMQHGMDENTLKRIAELSERLLLGESHPGFESFPITQRLEHITKALPDIAEATVLGAAALQSLDCQSEAPKNETEGLAK